MNYRTRIDIAASILAAAGEGETKFRIMYKANLSYAIFAGYIGTLLNNGLLDYIERGRIYRTSVKGKQFLVSRKSDQRTLISRISKGQIVDKIMSILRENKNGLTATQIAWLTGVSVQGDVLRRLRKEGRIKTRKGISTKDRPTLLYVLNENKS